MARSPASAGTADAALVAAWDDAMSQPAWRRALVLLSALTDGRPVDGLPVGTVWVRLLKLARRWSIRRVDTTATCGACGERLDVTLDIDDLLADAPPVEADPAPFPVPAAGDLLVRLPTPADLAAVAACPDPASAEHELLRRCVQGGAAAPSHVDAVSAAMAERDPYGVIAVDIACPVCATPAQSVLDVAGWWWGIADAWVRRLLGDVHRLARAYGWTEPEVLALGPYRRSAYLELVP